MSEHSPLPWFLFGGGTDPSPGIESADETTVVVYGEGGSDDAGVQGATPEQAKANAAFIVRAVNSHEALVKALEDIHSWLVCHPIASDSDMAESFPRMIEIANSALAKAAP